MNTPAPYRSESSAQPSAAPQLRLVAPPPTVRGPVNGDGWSLNPKACENLARWLHARGLLAQYGDSELDAAFRIMGSPHLYTAAYNTFRASGDWRAP